jgi:hypothetical protein
VGSGMSPKLHLMCQKNMHILRCLRAHGYQDIPDDF